MSLRGDFVPLSLRLKAFLAIIVTARERVSQVHSAEKNNPVNCFSRGGGNEEFPTVGTFMANEVKFNNDEAVQTMFSNLTHLTINVPTGCRFQRLCLFIAKPFALYSVGAGLPRKSNDFLAMTFTA